MCFSPLKKPSLAQLKHGERWWRERGGEERRGERKEERKREVKELTKAHSHDV